MSKHSKPRHTLKQAYSLAMAEAKQLAAYCSSTSHYSLTLRGELNLATCVLSLAYLNNQLPLSIIIRQIISPRTSKKEPKMSQSDQHEAKMRSEVKMRVPPSINGVSYAMIGRNETYKIFSYTYTIPRNQTVGSVVIEYLTGNLVFSDGTISGLSLFSLSDYRTTSERGGLLHSVPLVQHGEVIVGNSIRKKTSMFDRTINVKRELCNSVHLNLQAQRNTQVGEE